MKPTLGGPEAATRRWGSKFLLQCPVPALVAERALHISQAVLGHSR